MEDIYDDLENYNDVNAIDELRNENEKLKFRLAEIKSAMDKLQKEYDHLSAEYKTLEFNYSSLLRTARAEVERKTQLIANLNVEKDMLVLSSIQNSNKGLLVLRRNVAREMANNRKSRKDDAEGKTNKKDSQDVKKNEPERVRNDENRQPSLDSVSSGQIDDINKSSNIENKLGKLDYEKSSETKENITKGKRALSLKHRRKSMPVLSKQLPTFSSDEEYDDDCSDDGNKRERPTREDKSRKYFDRHKLSHKVSETSGIDEKYSSYHESSRETYYKGKTLRPTEKYRPRDKSRHRKHFSPEKSRRIRDYHEDREDIIRHNRVLVSPPRESYNNLRLARDRRSNYERDRSLEGRHRRDDLRDERLQRDNFHEERHAQRHDFEERRGYKDDIPDERHMPRYGLHDERQRDAPEEERFKQREASQEKRQRHTDPLKQRGASQEGRHRSRPASPEDKKQRGTSQEDKLTQRTDFSNEKHKRNDSLDTRLTKDEPTEERPKDDRNDKKRKQRSQSREERNRRQEKSSKSRASSDYDEPNCKRARIEPSKPAEAIRWSPPPPNEEYKLMHGFAEHLQHTSCQSPDNPHLDAQPTTSKSAQPKEIKNTAATFLEDPRLISKKYTKAIEGDKVILTTATGRNVDLTAIDISTWDIPRVEVPAPLQKPLEFTDEIVHDIYMDIDNPVSNMSLESGEINSESSDVRMADYLSKNFYQDYENERLKQIEARAEKQINIEHKKEPRKDNIKEIENVRKADPLHVENKENPENTRERTISPVKYKEIAAKAEKQVVDVETKRDPRKDSKKEEGIVPKDKAVHVENKEEPSNTSERKLPPVKYKIPRTSNVEAKQDTPPNPLGILLKQLHSVCGVDTTTKPPEAKLDVDQTFGVDEETQDKETKDKKEENKPKETRQLRQRKMSARELVEGDLALSDETSDNVFTRRQNKKEKLKDHSSDNSKNDNKKKRIKEPTNDNNKNDNQETAVGTAKEIVKPVNISVEKKTRKSKIDNKVREQKEGECKTNETTEKQSDDKSNKKTRKKSTSKQKDGAKESAKNDDVKLMEKKTKGRKSKSPKDQSERNKITALFGDSSSLITPEDLGVVTEAQNEKANKYIPIFEDAQDSVDVNVSAMKQTEILATEPAVTSSKINEPAKVREVSSTKVDEPAQVSKEKPTSIICKISLPNTKALTNLNKNNDTISPIVQNITPNMEVSNEELPKEPDVVKTVIISTGVQPLIEDIEIENNNLVDKRDNVVTKMVDVPIPIALATSTPHKKLLLQLEADVESSKSCNSTTSEVQRTGTSIDQSSMSNGVSSEAQNDDVPDVRIFVKRRRRIRK